MDALAAAGWAWSAPGQHTTVGSGRGWLGDGHGRCMASTPEQQAGHNGSVRVNCVAF